MNESTRYQPFYRRLVDKSVKDGTIEQRYRANFPGLPPVRHQDKEALTQVIANRFGMTAAYLVDTAHTSEENHLYRLSVESKKRLTIGLLNDIDTFLSGFIAGRRSL